LSPEDANRLLWQTVLIPLGKFVSAGGGRRVPVVSLFGHEYAVFGSFPDTDQKTGLTKLVGRTSNLWLHWDDTIRDKPLGRVVAAFDQLEPVRQHGIHTGSTLDIAAI
jgi:hypothetical protein